MKKILCICFSATFQRSVSFAQVELEKVNRSEHYGLYASGKAVNSARILAQMEPGCVETVCPLGQENMKEFIELADSDKLNLSYVTVPGKIRECWTLLDRKNASTTELVVGENNGALWTDEVCRTAEIKFLKLINEKLSDDDVAGVILAGSRQGKWSDDIYATIAGMAEDAGKVFLADYIGPDLLATLRACPGAIVKINDEEFCKTFLSSQDFEKWNSLGDGEKTDEFKSLLAEKNKEYGNIFVITRGTRTTIAAHNGNLSEYDVELVKPVNTTACGDSFNAGFMWEFLHSKDLAAAVKKGTWCAARNAESEVPGSIN